MNPRVVSIAAALCASTTLWPASASAQTPDAWQFRGMVYGYFPDLNGTVKSPRTGESSSATVDASTILESLKMTFMGTLEAQKGQWGLFTDVFYADLGDSKSGARKFAVGESQIPAGVSANVDLDIKTTLWTLGGSYRAVDKPGYTLDLLAGARLLDVQQTLKWQLSGDIATVPLPGRAGDVDSDLTNWDAIVGVKGRAAFGADQKWFVPYYLDVGTGESDFTGQAIVGIGYAFTWGEVVAAYRYIDYRMKSGEALEDLSFRGPAIGVAFRW